MKAGFHGYVSSIFTVDFGEICIGETRTLRRLMHTVTPIPINFQIDTSEIEDTGMSITPDDLSEVLYN